MISTALNTFPLSFKGILDTACADAHEPQLKQPEKVSYALTEALV